MKAAMIGLLSLGTCAITGTLPAQHEHGKHATDSARMVGAADAAISTVFGHVH